MAKKRETGAAQFGNMATVDWKSGDDVSAIRGEATAQTVGAPIASSPLLRVDFGGIGQGREWLTVNLDDELRAAPDIKADFTAKAAQLDRYFETGVIDAARAIHTLEHIESDQIIPTLHYWRKFLKPGAPLIIVVPDMGALAHDYAAGKITMGVLSAVTYVPGSRVQSRMPELHKWGFDAELLIWTLHEAGYQNARFGGDEHWPASWTFDMTELAYTGQVGHYEVPNLRMVADA